ncbi:hypothetical protein Btru_023571 [Bulinus truncatus]|nr:hypothetical protein Btru_023571 [Bulinus truncatus]
MLSVVAILLLIDTSASGQCNSITSVCSTVYQDKTNLQPVGCNEATVWSSTSPSKLSCASACSMNRSCAVFGYFSQSQTCYMCHGELISGINFSSDVVVSWPVQNVESDWPLTDPANNFTDRGMSIPIYVTSGTLVQLYGYYYTFDGFYIDLRQDYKGDDVMLHFRSRLQAGTNISVIILNYQNKTVWGPETRLYPWPYPFQTNTNFTVDILVRKDSYQIYIDRTFCCMLKHVLPYDNIRYLRIVGNVKVYEFSV